MKKNGFSKEKRDTSTAPDFAGFYAVVWLGDVVGETIVVKMVHRLRTRPDVPIKSTERLRLSDGRHWRDRDIKGSTAN